MEIRNPAVDFAFTVGNVGGVTVRISYFFPLLIAVCVLRLGVPLGLTVSGILFVSVLIHEFAHIWGARATGGTGDEILLWPLGGLAMVRTANTLKSKLITTLMGPASNLALCLACAPATSRAGAFPQIFNPLELPSVALAQNWGMAVQILAFSLNWTLFLINLLPILPFDGGAVALAFWEQRRPVLEARSRAIMLSLFGGVVVAFVGLWRDSTSLVTLSTFMLFLNLNDFYQTRIRQVVQSDMDQDAGFMGYDFSQGYTSLEKGFSDTDDDLTPPPTPATSNAKDEKRRQREAEERAANEKRLDELLEKVHNHGMNSLSEEERRFLQQASTRYRRS